MSMKRYRVLCWLPLCTISLVVACESGTQTSEATASTGAGASTTSGPAGNGGAGVGGGVSTTGSASGGAGGAGGLAPDCGAGPAGDEEGLLAHRSGFAADVTGGAQGTHIILDSLDEGAFVAAVSGHDPKWIQFAPGLSGEIVITGNVDIGSNTTIDGRGADITLTAPGGCHEIQFWGEDHSNLIVHNITFHKVGTGDNCGQAFGMAFGSSNVWLDHCTFTENGDESASSGHGSTDFTMSFTRFYNTGKGSLLSWNPNHEEDANTRVTIHHSAYLKGPDYSVSRIPKIRRGKVHFYNNVIDGWGWSAVEITQYGEGLIERNHFNGYNDTYPAMMTAAGADPEGGWVCDMENVIIDATAHDDNPAGYDCSKVFKATDYYSYEASEANEALKSMVVDLAGRSDSPKWCLSR